MDVLTALSFQVSFPLSPEKVEMVATKRNLEGGDEFSKVIASSPDFQLATADMIRIIVTSPDVSEGGVSISMSDRKALIGIANSIYSIYEPKSLILEQFPTVEPIYD